MEVEEATRQVYVEGPPPTAADREVYVGGLPQTATEQSVATFFNCMMSEIGGFCSGDAVVKVYLFHKEEKFAFMQMRSVEGAIIAMALDGIIFEGAPVRVRRHGHYHQTLAATLCPSQVSENLNLGAVGSTPGSAGRLEGPDCIFVGNLPCYISEARIRELMESVGPLRGLDLVKDEETGKSKECAFCVYQDPSVTDIACGTFNGIEMGGKALTVRRANQGASQLKWKQESVLLHALQQAAERKLTLKPPVETSKVICLADIVNPEELKDDECYEAIVEDMKLVCGKFGKLVNVVIPRPGPSGEIIPGVGMVFLEYTDVESALKAWQGLHGRKFDGLPAVPVFYPENKFSDN